MKILHVVRRLGPVGGMERYVYELVLALLEMGHQVEVVCEEVLCDVPRHLLVHQVSRSAPRPRWLALFLFRKKVAHWLRLHPHPGWIIHSHERSIGHHVSTFHGQPFATVFERSWLRLISLRVWMHLLMERQELSIPLLVVPNSEVTRQQLCHYYADLAPRIVTPVAPGTTCQGLRAPRALDPSGGTVAFIGTEWRRKGLAFAVSVVAELRKTRPLLKLVVVGPAPEEVAHLFADWRGGYELLGWMDRPNYGAFDVLLHPAKAEPYGMVVTEALAAQVRVVISDRCGVAPEIRPGHGAVLSLDAPLGAWADALDHALSHASCSGVTVRSWQTAAWEYQEIYAEVARSLECPVLPADNFAPVKSILT